MKYYEVTLGMNAAHEQNTLISKLKSAGADVIQFSSGLIVKSPSSIKDLLGDEAEGLSCKPIETSAVSGYSKDVQQFLSGRV